MLNFKGILRSSLIDYPGQITAVLFLPKCNFRCPFCHNPELSLFSEKGEDISEELILSFLDDRKGKLDAITITGGEPTLSEGLLEFLKKVKDKGFLVKLDSNGTRPEVLEELIPYVDFIAMDIKSSLESYERNCGVKVDLEKIKRSVELIKNSGKDYEFRTTLVRSLTTEEDIKKICSWLKGSKRYVLQQFDKRNLIINEDLKSEVIYTKEEMENFKIICSEAFEEVDIRGY